MDHSPRVPTYNVLATVQVLYPLTLVTDDCRTMKLPSNSPFYCQTAAHLLSVGLIIHAHSVHSTLASSVLLRPWFIVLVLAGAVERLSGLALGVAVERDWIVLVLIF